MNYKTKIISKMLVIFFIGIVCILLAQDPERRAGAGESLIKDYYRSARSISSEIEPYDGKEREISCWGDSLTEGTGAYTDDPDFANITVNGQELNVNGATMPGTLEEMTGIKTYNMGVYGEQSRDIAARQGGLQMFVQDGLTIPETGNVKFDYIVCEDGNILEVGHHNSYGQRASFNECTIGGVKGRLTYNLCTQSYTFHPDASGKEIKLSQEEAVIVTPPSVEQTDNILVLEMGNNGGWDNNYNELVRQYDAMIQHNQNLYYIIIGDTDLSAEDDEEWETELKEAYGDHYINMREYLLENGLRDCGLEPVDDDLDMMSRGEVPYSLKSDESHLNGYGYWAEAKAVYERGCQLGYWS